MDRLHRISELVESKRDIFIGASDSIWDFAETRFEEFNSAALLREILRQEGFDVEETIDGIDTAFIGSFGSGKPVIAILGEYDALFGMSQKAGVTQKQALVKDASGHGCGHNLLGTGALAGAVALKDYLLESGLPGTVRYYGCPAEESGYGKSYLVRAGVFDDVDFALTWHPASTNVIWNFRTNAVLQMYFRFKGKSAHAAGAPHLGRSALDAVELMNVGVNYLREHVVQQARIHYAITNSGGKSPNVVQSEAESYYFVRAPQLAQAKEVYERVVNIAKGAALMTDTQLEVAFDGGCSDYMPNATLSKLMHDALSGLGAPAFDEEDKRLAAEFRDTLPEDNRNVDAAGNKALAGKALADVVTPYPDPPPFFAASTDVGDVSWVTPTAQCFIACAAIDTPLHSWQMVAQGKSAIAHKGMLLAGKVIAATALEAIHNPALIQSAKQDFARSLDGQAYISPLPEDAKPSAMVK